MSGTARFPADDRVGTRIGEYMIDALIAVGGMGKVYRATATDGTRVALKIVKDALARDETFRRRFRREARIAQTIRNRHVVAVRETGEHDGTPFLVTQLIEGLTLDQKLRLDAPLDLATTVRLCADVADGLDAVWRAGMVHRDVKPANILLDQAETAYVTDFGLAKDNQGSVLTRPGQALGSVDYMAPEQIRGDPVTGATDVYALGCVAFECVDGRPPFADQEGMAVLWAHLHEEPRDPSPELGVPPVFTRALKSALRKDPGDRPASGVEYARMLAQAAGLRTGYAAG